MHGDESSLGVANVGTIGRRGAEVVADTVHRIGVEYFIRVNGVPVTLAHLPPIGRIDESMGEHAGGERQLCAHEHARPDDAVEPDDVLPNNVLPNSR